MALTLTLSSKDNSIRFIGIDGLTPQEEEAIIEFTNCVQIGEKAMLKFASTCKSEKVQKYCAFVFMLMKKYHYLGGNQNAYKGFHTFSYGYPKNNMMSVGFNDLDKETAIKLIEFDNDCKKEMLAYWNKTTKKDISPEEEMKLKDKYSETLRKLFLALPAKCDFYARLILISRVYGIGCV